MEKDAGSGDDPDRPQMMWDGTQFVAADFRPELAIAAGDERALRDSVPTQRSDSNSAYGVQFTAAEVTLNRTGKMSVMQRLRLFRGDIGWWLVAALLIGVPALLFVAVRAGILPLDLVKGIRALLLALYSLGVGLWALYTAVDVGIDSARGRVHSQLTHLPVSPSTLEQHRTFYSFRTDDGAEVRVRRADFTGLNPDHLYRVCFAPVSKQLISIEDAGPSYGAVPRL